MVNREEILKRAQAEKYDEGQKQAALESGSFACRCLLVSCGLLLVIDRIVYRWYDCTHLAFIFCFTSAAMDFYYGKKTGIQKKIYHGMVWTAFAIAFLVMHIAAVINLKGAQ